MADWSDLKGMTIPQASERAAKYQHVIHVIKQGSMLADPHRNYQENRINVEVDVSLEPKVIKILGRY